MARYNVNRLGRFSSIDPLSGNISNPQSLNHYAYVANDPINMVDPLGLDPSSSGSDVCTVNPGLPVCNQATAIGGDPGDLNCTLDGISTNCGSINQQDAIACVFSGCKGFLRGPTGESEIVYEVAYTNSTATTLQYVALSAVQIEVLGLSPEFGNFAGLFPSLLQNGTGTGPAPSRGIPNVCPAGMTGTTKNMLVTGYDNSYQSTQKNPGDPGYGITASGTVAAAGTIAAPRTYAFGTQMYVPGYGLGAVEDRGGAIKGSHIDIWFATTQEANNWGAQHLQVTVCK